MTDTSATWNDERVELLKKLWAEGKSASQIASEIGGISRNAVIGKVHRLGLAGRPKAGAAGGGAASGGRGGKAGNAEVKSGSGASGTAEAVASGGEPAQQIGGGAADSSATRSSAARGDAADGARQNATAGAAGDGAPRAGSDNVGARRTAGTSAQENDRVPRNGQGARSDNVAVLPECEQRVTIMELREGMCRWPIGDPTSPEFRFCGARADIGSPYCDHHARIAYQPAADRRRERKTASG